jgi:hypothetical protein
VADPEGPAGAQAPPEVDAVRQPQRCPRHRQHAGPRLRGARPPLFVFSPSVLCCLLRLRLKLRKWVAGRALPKEDPAVGRDGVSRLTERGPSVEKNECAHFFILSFVYVMCIIRTSILQPGLRVEELAYSLLFLKAQHAASIFIHYAFIHKYVHKHSVLKKGQFLSISIFFKVDFPSPLPNTTTFFPCIQGE